MFASSLNPLQPRKGFPPNNLHHRPLSRAPSERIRTASEIPIEVNLTDEGAVPVYMKISEKVLHLRRLGMAYATIAERLKINLWMAKRAARWGKTHLKRRENTSPY